MVVLVANPLRSTYRAGENRVTSSTMAVLERIDLALVQELLEAASGTGGELRTVVFENQIVEKDSVPDARISARFTWWFETKTARGGYATEGHDREQLRSHSKKLEVDADARLFVLTPDAARACRVPALPFLAGVCAPELPVQRRGERPVRRVPGPAARRGLAQMLRRVWSALWSLVDALVTAAGC